MIRNYGLIRPSLHFLFFLISAAASGADLSVSNGPFAGGNAVIITNCVPDIGNASDITNVTVGGGVAMIGAQGGNWVRIVMPSATTWGPKDIIIESASVGQTTLANAYTYNRPGCIFDPRLVSPSPMAAGGAHRLGLKTDGSIVAWGSNSHGQCNVPYPNSNFVAVSAGYYHSAGLKSDGSIVCWGDNTYGQTAVPDPNTDFIAVDAGSYQTVGLKSDGRIVRWGCLWGNVHVLPSPNVGFVDVAAGFNHGVALKPDGSIVCWGGGEVPIVVPAPNTNFVAVEANDGYSLGLKSDGSIVRWGSGYSNVYDGSFVEISAGMDHFLGMTSNGMVVCRNVYGEGECTVPAPNTNFVAVAAGGGQSMGLKSDGRIIVWGEYAESFPVPEPNADFGFLNGVLPASGSWTGGYPVIISGSNLCDGADATNVTLCGVPATIVTQSATRIIVTAGTSSAQGAGDVRVFSRSFGETVKSNSFAYTAPVLSLLGTNGESIATASEPDEPKGNDFGHVLAGRVWTNVFCIVNSGNAELVISSVTTAGVSSSKFQAIVPSNLSAGASTNLKVIFTAGAPGDDSAMLVFTFDAPSSPFVLNLSASPYVLSTNVGPYAGGNSVTITNGALGNGADITNVLVGGVAATIGAQGTTWVTITLPAASSAGPKDVLVQSSSLGDTMLTGAYSYNPTGLITQVAPAFGSWTGGYRVVISGTNLCNGDDVTNVTLCGVPAALVTPSPGEIIVAAGTSSVAGVGDVRVHSVAFGETVLSNAFTYTTPILSLRGTNTELVASGSPASVDKGTDFGHVAADRTWTRVFSITNSGTTGLLIRQVTTSGVSSSKFRVSGCPSSLPVGGVANMGIAFTPASPGRYSAQVTLSYDGLSSPFVLNLAGSGSPFGPYAGGNSITLTNAGLGNGSDITNVLVGGVAAVISAQGTNWVTIVLPPSTSSGAKDVLVQSASAGETSIEGAYWYNKPGVITGILPAYGPNTGNYSVVIVGSNLCDGADITGVTLCGFAAAIVAQSMTQVIVRAGAANVAGPGDVRMDSVSYGETVASNAFTYTSPNLLLVGTNGAVIASGSAPGPAKGSDFGTVLAGQTRTHVFGITNNGDFELLIHRAMSTNPAFRVMGYPGHLPVGGTGQLSVVFEPQAAGNFAVQAVVSNNGTGSPFVFNLTGIAYGFAPAKGPFTGGNVATLTNALAAWGNGADITNVTVGGASATILAQGANWVTMVLPALGSSGSKDVVVQSASVGDTSLDDAYTYNPAGLIVDQCLISSSVIAAGSDHVLALKTDGRIVAWGDNDDGQLDVPAPNDDFVMVAAGDDHSLGLKWDGTVQAWGDNYFGQTNVPAPNANFVAVAAGEYHSLGLKSDGSIVAWGRNDDGQCDVPEPNADFIAVSGGDYHSLGLKSDGSIVAWGDNDMGQCDVPEPNANFIAIAAASEYSIGLKSDGTLVAWGDGSDGQTDIALPNAGFVGFSAGTYHVLGLKSDGTGAGWGDNYHGEASLPTPNTGLVAVAAGHNEFSVVLRSNGTLLAWGYNYNGQTNVPAPNANFGVWHGVEPVFGSMGGGYRVVLSGSNLCDGTDVTNVTLCGYPATIVAQSAHRVVVTAGAASLGGLGDVRIYSVSFGETVKSDAFTYTCPMFGLLGANGETIAGGAAPDTSNGTDFGARRSGEVWAHLFTITNSGDEDLVISGVTTTGVAAFSLQMDGLPMTLPLGGVTNLMIGFAPVAPGDFSAQAAWVHNGLNSPFLLNLAGSAYTLSTRIGPYAGGNSITITNGVMGNGSDITNVTVGGMTAAITAQGINWVTITLPAADAEGVKDIVIQSESVGDTTLEGAYSYNARGYIIDHPVLASPLAVAAGDAHSVALKSDGSVIAWGDNYSGQLNLPEPNTNFVAVAAGSSHSLGLKSDGSVVGWGNNEYGSCDVPAPNSNFTAVAAADSYSVGLKSDGSLVAWGIDWMGTWSLPEPNTGFVAIAAGSVSAFGLKSDGSLVAWRDYYGYGVPNPNTGFVAVAAGTYHSLALKSDGSIVAWGENGYGECTVPEPNSNFVAIAAGYSLSLGLKSDGSIVAWGYGEDCGQTNVPEPNAGFVALSTRYIHSIGLKSNGSVVAWGWNDSGQCNVPEPNADFGIFHTGLQPTSGSWTGGYSIVIMGSNLGDGSDVTNVTLCGASATIVTQSPTRLVVTAGTAIAAGLGDVRIYSVSFGETVGSNLFTYSSGPTLAVLGTNGEAIARGETASAAKGTDFGSLTWGLAVTNYLSVTNTGEVVVSINAFTTNGAGAAQFSISGLPVSLEVGEVVQFPVVFHPSGGGAFNASLQLAGEFLGTPMNIELAGTGLRKSQAIAFPPIATQSTTNLVGLSAAADSGLPVSFIVASGPATIANGTNLSFTSAGEVSIVASQAGNADWRPAADVTNTFNCLAAYSAHNVPAGWLEQYGLTLEDDDGDQDHDGFKTWEEYMAGTVPTDGASFFQCSEISRQNLPIIGIILRWTASSGRVYSIECSTNLLAPWSELATNLPPNGAWTSTVNGGNALIHYRLGVKAP
jgi:alpha-tubulin suppressor-like RCC1 family protein